MALPLGLGALLLATGWGLTNRPPRYDVTQGSFSTDLDHPTPNQCRNLQLGAEKIHMDGDDIFWTAATFLK